jgi:hypothetical protein
MPHQMKRAGTDLRYGSGSGIYVIAVSQKGEAHLLLELCHVLCFLGGRL